MKFTLFDTHCHPQFPQFDADRDEVIRRAQDNGVGMICVGTDLETSRVAIALAERYEGLYASVGLHPNDTNDTPGDMYDQKVYQELLCHKKVVAVGEIGLDYYRTKEPELQEVQRTRFEQQLTMAKDTDLPVIIHCRDAHKDMREILSTFRGIRGVIHSFTGTWDDARAYLEMGFSIGLNGIITFARNYDDTVINLPLERLLLETDAPYLAPIPYRGKRNEPAYVIEVARKIAEIRGSSLNKVMERTTHNALAMFIKE